MSPSRAQKHALLAVALVAVAIAAQAPTADAWGGNDRVLLKDVETLTLYRGKMTTGRRSPPVQQLVCVGGDACGLYEPETMQCKNQGYDGVSVQWKCASEMDDYYRLGRTTVSCEGYANKRDKYVLAGSCGVEYTLHLTDKGKAAFQGSHDAFQRHARAGQQQRRKAARDEGGMSPIKVMIMLGIGAYILRKWCTPSTPARDSQNRRRPPGGHSDHSNPPPPPYSPTAPPRPKSPTGPYPIPPASGAQSSGPGFWTGAAMGGAAGYAAGRVSASSSAAHDPLYPHVRDEYGDDPLASATATAARTRARARAQQRQPGAWTESPAREPSPPRTHTSTGHGGTQTRGALSGFASWFGGGSGSGGGAGSTHSYSRSSSRSSRSSSPRDHSSTGYGGTSNR